MAINDPEREAQFEETKALAARMKKAGEFAAQAAANGATFVSYDAYDKLRKSIRKIEDTELLQQLVFLLAIHEEGDK